MNTIDPNETQQAEGEQSPNETVAAIETEVRSVEPHEQAIAGTGDSEEPQPGAYIDEPPSGPYPEPDHGIGISTAETTPIKRTELSFGEALEVIEAGGRITRAVWNAPRPYVSLHDLEVGRIRITYRDGSSIAFAACEADILAKDWINVTEASS